MIKPNRATISVAVIALAMVAAVVASLSFLADCSDEADRTSADVAATKMLVEQIESLRPARSVEDSKHDLASVLPAVIDTAMKSAEIDPQDLERITPQTPRHLGQTSESEIPLQLIFRQITLHQALAFIESLTQDKDRIYVRELHLIHPPEIASDGPNALWNVEITISYLTDAPN